MERMNQDSSGNPKTGSAMEYYTCKHCEKTFIPRRRWVQKYCSESCRVLACRARIPAEMGLKVIELPQAQIGASNDLLHEDLSAIKNMLNKLSERVAELGINSEVESHSVDTRLNKINSNVKANTLVSFVAPALTNLLKGTSNSDSAKTTPQDLTQQQFENELLSLCQRRKLSPEQCTIILQNVRQYSQFPDGTTALT